MMTKTASNIGLTVVVTVLVLIASEFLLRSGIVPNPEYRRLQFQGDTQDPEKRLLILGDSFIAREGDLGMLLHHSLKDKGVLIRNLAVSGYGPVEYYAEFMTDIDKFRPDIVLLSYYAGNDLGNVQYHVPGKDDFASLFDDQLRPLYFKSYLYRLIREAKTDARISRDIQRIVITGNHAEYFQEAVSKGAFVNPYLIEGGSARKDFFRTNLMIETPESRKAWNKIERFVTEMKEKCDAIGAKLIVVVFPNTLQVDDSHHDFYEKLGYDIDQDMPRSQKPQRLFAEFCGQSGAVCLDLLPVFKEAEVPLYLSHDDHLNPDGNELAAERIVEALLALEHAD